MRKLLLVVLAFVCVLVLIAGVFVFTFDINKYKPAITAELKKTLGNDVEIDRLYLSMKGKTGFGIKGMRVLDASGRSVMSLEACDVSLQLWPLLTGRVIVDSIYIDYPKIDIFRSRDGNITVKGISAPQAAEAKSGQTKKTGQNIIFHIKTLAIAGGEIRFFSGSANTMSLQLKNIDCTVNDISPAGPVRFAFKASLSDTKQNVNIKGSVKDPMGNAPVTDISVDVSVPSLKVLLTALIPGALDNFDGKAALKFNGTMTGKTGDDIKRSLTGSGDFSLDNGIILDSNIAKQALDTLTIFPGLSEVVQSYVPEVLKNAISSKDTILKPVRQTFTVRNGSVDMDSFVLGTDFFSLSGRVTAGLEGSLEGNGALAFNAALSESLVKSVKELGGLRNENGSIVFPISFKSKQGRFVVKADADYITKKIMVSKGEQLVTDIIKGASKSGSEGQDKSTSDSSKTIQGILNVLQKYTDKTASEDKKTVKIPVQ